MVSPPCCLWTTSTSALGTSCAGGESRSHGAIYGFNAWFYGSFTVAYVVIVVCYWKVFRAVSQHNAEVATNLRQGCHHEEVSVSKAVATIVLSFTLCWIPGEVMRTMGKINPLLLPRQVRITLKLFSMAYSSFFILNVNLNETTNWNLAVQNSF